jgi:hypothetical protein
LKISLGGTGKPFYIICVTKTGEEQLSSPEIAVVRTVIQHMLYGSSDDFRKDIATFYQNKIPHDPKNPFTQHLEADEKLKKIHKDAQSCWTYFNDQLQQALRSIKIPPMKNIPGFVIFSEYFFGKNSVPYEKAREISMSFSVLDISKIFAINFQVHSTNIDLDKMYNSDLRKFIIGQNRKQYNVEQRCRTEVLSSFFNETSNNKIENKSFFYHNNVLLATYQKGTYASECENLISGDKTKPSLAYYSFGDLSFHKETIGDSAPSKAIQSALIQNVSPQICLDYSFGKTKWNSNFQIIQSNTCGWPCSPVFYQQSRFDTDVEQHQGLPFLLNKSRYIIHCDAAAPYLDTGGVVYTTTAHVQHNEKALSHEVIFNVERTPKQIVSTFELNSHNYAISVAQIE